MKKWTKQINKQFEQVSPDGINDNTDQWIQNYNGGLDNQNLPVNLINNDKLVASAGSSSITSDITFTSWKGQTQSYNGMRSLAGQEHGLNDFLAIDFINLITDDWKTGWNNLSKYLPDAVLNVDLVEGMITGNFNINWGYGYTTFEGSSGGGGGSGPSTTWGRDWWIRWGLFMNGNLIADTGNAYPRTENTCVPFVLPVGSQNALFELRWQALTNNPDPALMQDPTEVLTSFINLYGFHVWINNTYK